MKYLIAVLAVSMFACSPNPENRTKNKDSLSPVEEKNRRLRVPIPMVQAQIRGAQVA